MVDETVHFVHTHTPTGVHEVSSVVDLHRSELRRLTFSGFFDSILGTNCKSMHDKTAAYEEDVKEVDSRVQPCSGFQIKNNFQISRSV